MIKDILYRMLRKNTGQRYESAEEILDEMNVHIDQPTIVINNADREGKTSKLAWLFITVIFIGIAAIFVVPMLKPSGENNPRQNDERGNVSPEDNSAKPNSIGQMKNETKDPVNLDNLKEPLIDNKKQDPSQNPKTEPEIKPNNPVGIGRLIVGSYPANAEVSIGGETYNSTPWDRPLPIQSGKYTIKFTHTNYPNPVLKEIIIKPDSLTRVYVNIEQETMGFIHCFVSQQIGDIYINGTKKAEVPMRTTDLIKVAPGWVRLVIKNPNYKNDIDTTFSVRAKDTLRLKFKFRN
jgi:hypothetical protein